MTAAPRTNGLTFVELLIAAMMFALLSVGLSYQLRGGITVWRRSQASTEQTQQVRMLLYTLARDCRNAILIDPAAARPKPEFLPERLSLTTIEPAPTGVAGTPALVYVTYRIDGSGQANTLVRHSQPYDLAAAGDSGEERTMALLSGIREFRLRYAHARPTASEGDPKWVWKERWQADEPWQAEDGMPRFIELALTQAASPDRAVEPVTLSLILDLPTGTLKPELTP